ncbi:MAG: hypothetical protein Q7R89_02665 [bacterium]|nr:hypothetical protein [bacterium]
MNTVTIPKKEYEALVEKTMRYEQLRKGIEEDIFSTPPIKNSAVIMEAFKATKKYNAEFLKSLEKGLKDSSYFSA